MRIPHRRWRGETQGGFPHEQVQVRGQGCAKRTREKLAPSTSARFARIETVTAPEYANLTPKMAMHNSWERFARTSAKTDPGCADLSWEKVTEISGEKFPQTEAEMNRGCANSPSEMAAQTQVGDLHE